MRVLIAIYIVLLNILTISSQNKLPEWKEGCLDIHFISTGQGNCMFTVFPDGTTMLVDAGEQDPTSPRVNSPRNTRRFPDNSRYTHQWQADYIKSVLRDRGHIDYALITHYHDDHYGGVYPGVPFYEEGSYSLSGITGLGTIIPIRKLVDRGDKYPFDIRKAAKEYPESLKSLINYWKFVDYQSKTNALKYEQFKVGSNEQFPMLNSPEKYSTFSIQNVVSNGNVWDGKYIFTLMPPDNDYSQRSVMPNENTLSCGILVSYGPFRFFAGADITGKQPDYEQRPEWYDIESVVAPYIGEVDLTTTNHHANRDAMTVYYLSVLKPRVIIHEVWSSDHPGHEALLRMTSRKIWPDERDLFATNMLDANRIVIGESLDKSYKSTQGHIVVRVMPGGKEYFVYTLNHLSQDRFVTAIYGPYKSKKQ